jgi:phage pi2 protein 07
VYTDRQFFDCVGTSDFTVNSNKRQLIYWALQRAVVENGDIPDYHMIQNKQKIYVNKTLYADFFKDTVNAQLDVGDIPAEIKGVQFCLKSKSELQDIANRASDFMYLSLGEIKIDTHYASIGITNDWMLSKMSMKAGEISLAGGGYVLQYYKKNGRWVFDRITDRWIS